MRLRGRILQRKVVVLLAILSAFAILLCFARVGLCADIVSQEHDPDTVGQYEKLELSFTLTGNYSDKALPDYINPFDQDQIKVDVTFTQPDGTQKVVPAFWYEEFDAQVESGHEIYINRRDLCWKARFAPMQVGTHSLLSLIHI